MRRRRYLVHPALASFAALATVATVLAVLALAVSSGTAAHAAGTTPPAATRPFTLEQVMSGPFPSNLAAARTGSRVAWIENRRGERNVWVADGPDFVPRQVTHYHGDDGQPLAALTLTPDGWTVLYARGTEVNGAGDSANPTNRSQAPKQQVWALDVEAGAAGKAEPRLLGDMGCPEEGCEDIEVSPDGRSALWVARHRIWMAPVAGGAAAKPLVEVQGDHVYPRWSPDGKRVAFMVVRHDHSFIAVFDVGGDSVRYLAPSVDRDELPHWSPDGARIAFIREPSQAEKLPLIPIRPRPWALWVGDPATGAAHELWHSSADLDGSLPPFAEGSLQYAAGDRIVFASEQNEHGRNHLYSVSATGAANGAPNGAPTGASGAPADRVLLTPGDDYDVEDVALSADRRTILFSSNQHSTDRLDEDRRHLWRVPAAGGATPQALTAGAGIEWSPIETGDGSAVLCFGSTTATPGQPLLVIGLAASASSSSSGAAAATNAGKEAAARRRSTTPAGTRALFHDRLPPGFPTAAQLVVPQQMLWKSPDGTLVHGQLFVPRDAPAGGHSLPALIFTHGGPVRQMLLGFHYMYYYNNAYAMNQYLASRGYVVLSVNYRLGIMYGRAFREDPHGSWRGSSEYADVLAGARVLQQLPQVDTKRIGLWGGSYGGLLTALGLARNSDVFSAGVDFHGVHDWSMFLPNWEAASPSTAPDAREAYKLAFESSPVAAMDGWHSPVLLIHGDDDRNVPFGQTRDLVQRLRQRHVQFEELIFPDEIHDLLLWRDWVSAYQAGVDFFGRRLAAATPPTMPTAPTAAPPTPPNGQ